MFGLKVPHDDASPLESDLAADLEDMTGTKVNAPKGPRPLVRTFESDKQRKRSDCVPDSEQDTPNRNSSQLPAEKATTVRTPDKNADYEAWLEYKKRKWKETREKRKRIRFVHLTNWYREY